MTMGELEAMSDREKITSVIFLGVFLWLWVSLPRGTFPRASFGDERRPRKRNLRQISPSPPFRADLPAILSQTMRIPRKMAVAACPFRA